MKRNFKVILNYIMVPWVMPPCTFMVMETSTKKYILFLNVLYLHSRISVMNVQLSIM